MKPPNVINSQPSVKKVLLLINPQSRRGRDAQNEAAAHFKNLGCAILTPDVSPDQFSAAIAEHAATVDVVAVGGGDGSVRASLAGIITSNQLLAVLPLGTSNNLARNLNLPLKLEDACRTALSSRHSAVDVAYVNDKPFLNVVGIGLSTEVNKTIPKELKRRWGPFGYVMFALKVGRHMKPIHAIVVCDGERHLLKSLQITICNGRFYGAGMVVNETASISDQKLDLLSTEVEHWWQVLPQLPRYLWGKHRDNQTAVVLRGQRLRVETRKPYTVDVDGDALLKTPIELRLEGTVRIAVPEDVTP